MPQTSLRFRHVDESVRETLKPDLTSELSSWLEKVENLNVEIWNAFPMPKVTYVLDHPHLFG